MNIKTRAVSKKLPTPRNATHTTIFRYQLRFCRMWIREYGVMPTRWIINDFSKQLTHVTHANNSNSFSIDEPDFRDFTIRFINGYH